MSETNDGHTGTQNVHLAEAVGDDFRCVLSALAQASGHIAFIMHVSRAPGSTIGDHARFLQAYAFNPYKALCALQGGQCFYREVAMLSPQRGRSRVQDRLDSEIETRAKKVFEHYHERLSAAFALYSELFRTMGAPVLPAALVPDPIEFEGSEEPAWVECMKFPRLNELEQRLGQLNEEIAELRGFLPLLHGTGRDLELAVQHALRFLGLNAELTAPGTSVDVVAQTSDGSLGFGIEVTGTSGSIGKDSKKLTQVLDFERTKEENEKTLLVAVTHNSTPVSERVDLEDFTGPAVEFLSNFPILLLTGLDLYRLIGDVLAGSRTKEDVVRMLAASVGRHRYEAASG
jgi:hypothetical protein